MIVLLHVLMAFASLAYLLYAYCMPSIAKLRISVALTSATLLSGTYLVLMTKGHLPQACSMGLVFIGITSVGIGLTYRKLTAATTDR